MVGNIHFAGAQAPSVQLPLEQTVVSSQDKRGFDELTDASYPPLPTYLISLSTDTNVKWLRPNRSSPYHGTRPFLTWTHSDGTKLPASGGYLCLAKKKNPMKAKHFLDISLSHRYDDQTN